jgi:hypothetical protein
MRIRLAIPAPTHVPIVTISSWIRTCILSQLQQHCLCFKIGNDIFSDTYIKTHLYLSKLQVRNKETPSFICTVSGTFSAPFVMYHIPDHHRLYNFNYVTV